MASLPVTLLSLSIKYTVQRCGCFTIVPAYSIACGTHVHVNARRTQHTRAENLQVEEAVQFRRRKSDSRTLHIGNFRLGSFDVPVPLNYAINNAVAEKNPAKLRQDALTLSRRLHERETSLDRKEYRIRYNKFYTQFLNEERNKLNAGNSPVDVTQRELNAGDLDLDKIEKRAAWRTKGELYNWNAMNYTPYDCAKYAVGRINEEYAALRRVFEEIRQRDRNFRPKSVFDFGSGVGSTVWAAHEAWDNDPDAGTREYYGVDKNADMIDMAELLLRGGNNGSVTDSNTTTTAQSTAPLIRNVTFRQYLPGSTDRKFDLCVSAYSLMDLPKIQDRAVVLGNLWRKTKRYLVLIETGSKHGLKLILEARKLILTQGGNSGMRRNQREKTFGSPFPLLEEERRSVEEDDQWRPDSEEDEMRGYVFAPCPHDNECPAQLDFGDEAVCSFTASYAPINFMRPVQHKLRRTASLFSYVVLRKGQRPDANVNDDENNDDFTGRHHFHRLIRPVEKKSKCIYCTLCCADGRLRQPVVSLVRSGGEAFSVARNAQWGDLVPLRFPDEIYDRPKLAPRLPPSSASGEDDSITPQSSNEGETAVEDRSATSALDNANAEQEQQQLHEQQLQEKRAQ